MGYVLALSVGMTYLAPLGFAVGALIAAAVIAAYIYWRR